jgi:hypothetical protein
VYVCRVEPLDRSIVVTYNHLFVLFSDLRARIPSCCSPTEMTIRILGVIDQGARSFTYRTAPHDLESRMLSCQAIPTLSSSSGDKEDCQPSCIQGVGFIIGLSLGRLLWHFARQSIRTTSKACHLTETGNFTFRLCHEQRPRIHCTTVCSLTLKTAILW